MMRVADIMSTHVQCCAPEDSLEHVAQLMWDHDCGALPVCTGTDGARQAIGMITDRDVCMSALFQGKTLSQMRVRDAMSKRLLSCQPGDRLGSAEKVMRIGQVRRLPVVDDQGALVGLLSLADLAREAEREGPKTGKVITETDVGDTLAEICAPAKPVAAAA